jgi:N-dimethylarginine dimethylaminohydrolase
MALALVRPGLGVRCPEVFPEGMPASLAGWDWVDVDAEAAFRHMAVNLLPVDARTTLVPEEAPGVADALGRYGQEVLTTPFSGVSWLGGGLRCWSQPLLRSD